jgi:hypothetical protein
MNSSGAALLANPHPCGHIVYPYTDEALAGQAICLFASAGLRDGEGVILIVSEAHRKAIKLRLAVEGFDANAYQRSGQLVWVTASDLLEIFAPNGIIDEDIFRSSIGGMIEQARTSVSNGKQCKVRLFGEMVSQLRTKDLAATKRLEELWNGVIQTYSVALFCTYAMSNQADQIPEELIALHSHNIDGDFVNQYSR